MSCRLAGEFPAASGHREDLRRCDRFFRPPAFQLHRAVIQGDHGNRCQAEIERDGKPVMTVHHEQCILLYRNRNRPLAEFENLPSKLCGPNRIDLFRGR